MAYADLFNNDRLLLEFIASIEADTNINLLTDQEILSYSNDKNNFVLTVDSLIAELSNLEDTATEEDITFLTYECAKPYYGSEKADLKKWFKHLYMLWEHKETGPRLGTFIRALGVENFVSLLKEKFADPWNLFNFEENTMAAYVSMYEYAANKKDILTSNEDKEFVVKCDIYRDGNIKVFHEEIE